MSRSLAFRILTGLSSLIIFGTALFHATGYSSLQSSLESSSLPSFFRGAIPGIWLFFSWHLIAIAAALVWISIKASANSRPLLIFCALVICIDTIFVFTIAGIFAGTILLFVAALFLVVCAFQWQAFHKKI